MDRRTFIKSATIATVGIATLNFIPYKKVGFWDINYSSLSLEEGKRFNSKIATYLKEYIHIVNNHFFNELEKYINEVDIKIVFDFFDVIAIAHNFPLYEKWPEILLHKNPKIIVDKIWYHHKELNNFTSARTSRVIRKKEYSKVEIKKIIYM